MDRFWELLAGYLEGDLTSAERAELKRLLQSDPELERRFLEEISLHEGLSIVSRDAPSGRSELAQGVIDAWIHGATPAGPITQRPRPRAVESRRRFFMPALAAAGVVIGITVVLLNVSTPSRIDTRHARTVEVRPSDREEVSRQRREEVARVEKRLAEIDVEREKVAKVRNQAELDNRMEARRRAGEELARIEAERKVAEARLEEAKAEQRKVEEELVKQKPEAKPDVRHKPTVTAAATLERVEGQVGVNRIAAKEGQGLRIGQELDTTGEKSSAALRFPDGTKVDLGADSSLRLDPGKGKNVFVVQGTVTAEVSRQPAGQPMIFATPGALAEILGTRLTLSVTAESTKLSVDEGRVRLMRRSDESFVEVAAGQFAVVGGGFQFQAKPKGKMNEVPVAANPKVDQDKVNQAIDKGCKWLLSQKDLKARFGMNRFQPEVIPTMTEIVVLTLAHSGYTEEDPAMAALVAAMVKSKILMTYTASVQAMALQKLDPRKYQWRIAQCAQFLADNQAATGQWDYGEETRVEHYTPTSIKTPTSVKTPAEAPAPGATGGGSGAESKPTATAAKPPSVKIEPKLTKVPVGRLRKGPPQGDNSNSQYAALGLRACIDAGIVFEPDVLLRGRRWWVEHQNKDGGWGYGASERSVDSYGAMTVGGVGSVCIYDSFLGRDGKLDPSVKRGVDWIAANFDVKKNPKSDREILYYLYGLERAGTLYGTEMFGAHEWYVDGATHLLETQTGGGAWDKGMCDPNRGGIVADTCFAVLFLRRATRPLPPPPGRKPEDVASEDKSRK